MELRELSLADTAWAQKIAYKLIYIHTTITLDTMTTYQMHDNTKNTYQINTLYIL